jgi:hypothetical protein
MLFQLSDGNARALLMLMVLQSTVFHHRYDYRAA